MYDNCHSTSTTSFLPSLDVDFAMADHDYSERSTCDDPHGSMSDDILWLCATAHMITSVNDMHEADADHALALIECVGRMLPTTVQPVSNVHVRVFRST